jgi:hypothetical protein
MYGLLERHRKIGAVVQVVVPLSDELCGYAAHDRVGRNVFSDNRASGYYRTVPDSHVGQDDSPRANINIVFNDDRSSCYIESWAIDIVLERVDHDLGSGSHTISYRQAPPAIQKCSIANVAVLANAHATWIKEVRLPMDDASPAYVRTENVTIHEAAEMM